MNEDGHTFQLQVYKIVKYKEQTSYRFEGGIKVYGKDKLSDLLKNGKNICIRNPTFAVRIIRFNPYQVYYPKGINAEQKVP